MGGGNGCFLFTTVKKRVLKEGLFKTHVWNSILVTSIWLVLSYLDNDIIQVKKALTLGNMRTCIAKIQKVVTLRITHDLRVRTF